MHARLALAIAFLVAAATAQRTWIVDKAGGPGVDFTDIPPAIAAAVDGDTVSVRGSGSYSAFTFGKALAVESAGAALVPQITIQGLAAGASARVHGFVVGGPVSSSNLLGNMDVNACAGSLVLSGLQVTRGLFSREVVRVLDSSSVLLVDCAIVGGYRLSPPTAALAVTRSRVVVQRTRIDGPPGEDGCEIVWGQPGGYGISSTFSNVLVTDCAISGGTGGKGFDCGHGPACGADGGAAVLGDGIVVLGNSSLTGGSGGTNTGTFCTPTLQGPAASGNCLIASDASVSGALINGAQRIASLAWIKSPGSATLGASVTLTLAGIPGTGILLTADDRFAITPIGGLLTPLLVTPAAAFVGPFTIGAAGTLPLAFQVPLVPGWKGRSLFFQALAFEPVGLTLSLTNVGDLVLR